LDGGGLNETWRSFEGTNRMAIGRFDRHFDGCWRGLLHGWGPRGCYTVETAPVQYYLCAPHQIFFAQRTSACICSNMRRERERDIRPVFAVLLFTADYGRIWRPTDHSSLVGRARRQQGALPWKLGSVRSLLRDSPDGSDKRSRGAVPRSRSPVCARSFCLSCSCIPFLGLPTCGGA
jgi:hypothetical protein